MFYNKLFKLIERFAALSDAQYKSVFRNPHMLQLLDKSNKLDEFYKSMPNAPKQEIYDRIIELNEKSKESQEKLPDEVLSFMEKYGENHLPAMLIGQVERNMLYDEGYTDEQAKELSTFVSESNINKIILDYAKSPFDSTFSDLIKFTRYMSEYFKIHYSDNQNEQAKNMLGILLSRLTKVVDVMVKSIFAAETAEDRMLANLMQANDIRNSDQFDFLAGGAAEIVEESPISDVQPSSIAPEKIDYSDEATVAPGRRVG